MSNLQKQSNYLNPKRFYGDFLDWLVRLDEFHSERRPAAMDANHFYWAARIQYSIAGRISEILDLERADFDLNHRIVTFKETKTGYKYCKCAVLEQINERSQRKKLVSFDKDCSKC